MKTNINMVRYEPERGNQAKSEGEREARGAERASKQAKSRLRLRKNKGARLLSLSRHTERE